MAYVTLDQLQKSFGQAEILQLTDRNRTGAVDMDVLQRAIDDVTAQIDSFLAGHYVLPLSNIPANLVRIAADLVRYQLYDIKVNDLVKQRRDDAIEYLTKVSKGLVILGADQTGGPVRPDAGGGVKSIAPGRIFTDESLSGY